MKNNEPNIVRYFTPKDMQIDDTNKKKCLAVTAYVIYKSCYCTPMKNSLDIKPLI